MRGCQGTGCVCWVGGVVGAELLGRRWGEVWLAAHRCCRKGRDDMVFLSSMKKFLGQEKDDKDRVVLGMRI